jgi:ERCC4-type nuclease
MYAVIDDRETHLIDHINTCQTNTLAVHIKRLILADILLCGTTDDDVLCVIERKRLDDLIGSLHSGHMQEQLERLKESAKEVWIVIEHHPGHEDQKGHVMSWMIEILTNADYNNMRIVNTASVADTLLFIQKRASMLNRKEPSCRLSQWAPSKKRHLSVYLKSLLGIPGVSFKRAAAVRTLYPTLINLCTAIVNEPEMTEVRLKNAVGKSATRSIVDGITTHA